MKTYQLTLRGYDANTDKTDHLIKWVNAPSISAVQAYAKSRGWDVMQTETAWGDKVLTIQDGVDAILDGEGNRIA